MITLIIGTIEFDDTRATIRRVDSIGSYDGREAAIEAGEAAARAGRDYLVPECYSGRIISTLGARS